jgi:1-acyl-sn-glycerol-3-phosphate acyltransferase
MFLFRSKHRAIRKLWAKVQIFCIGATIEVVGKRDEDTRMFIINHKSTIDVALLEYCDENNPSWVAKKEIEDTPFFGNIIKLPKMISLDRKNKRSIIKLIKDIKDRLNEGRDIFIFPEGTRNINKKFSEFKSGAKVVADKLNLKIQPIVIINSQISMNETAKTSQKANIKIIYLDAIDKNDDNWLETTKKIMQKRYDDELANTNSNR